ncbi:MAG: hypothetical protein OSA86_10715 [Acidimicrobiales bacterium]|nr:hypothetical protein [Acidimicrobiales bacterium]
MRHPDAGRGVVMLPGEMAQDILEYYSGVAEHKAAMCSSATT